MRNLLGTCNKNSNSKEVVSDCSGGESDNDNDNGDVDSNGGGGGGSDNGVLDEINIPSIVTSTETSSFPELFSALITYVPECFLDTGIMTSFVL
jgi:hypothetical protein